MHPVADNIKVKVSEPDKYDLGTHDNSAESGIVVEVPDVIHYYGFHSFAFENSFMAKKDLEEIREYFKKLIGKRVWWQTFQDKGRRFKESDGEYVYLKMSDVLIYSDDVDMVAEIVDDTRSGGFRV